MLIALLQSAGGLVLLYFGGDRLIKGASALASNLGISPLAIGLTVVAFGTSAPELVVSLGAALSGANDIAVGNIVGSNIANVAFILALAALVRPMKVEAKIVRIDLPIMILVSCALALVLINKEASRLEGALLLAGLLCYTIFTFWQSRKETEQIKNEFASAAPGVHASTLMSSMFVIVGLALLVGGGQLLVTAAVTIATLLGISQAVIGLTVVAVGTSLPELSTTLIAAARGNGDIAIGNVIGSNIFNILGILGLTATIRPLEMGAITWIDLGMMIALAFMVTVFFTTRLQMQKIEGAILLAGYLLYTAWLLTA